MSELRVGRDALLGALKEVARFAAEYVLLSWQNEQLTLHGTDWENYLSWTMECASGTGQVVLPIRDLIGLVDKFTEAVVTIEAQGALADIKNGQRHFRMKGVDVQEFPQRSARGQYCCQLSVIDFLSIAQHVAWASGDSNANPVYQGVYWQFETPFKAVASDGIVLSELQLLHVPLVKMPGYRVAGGRWTYQQPASGVDFEEQDIPLRLLVPAKSLTVFARVLGKVHKLVTKQRQIADINIYVAMTDGLPQITFVVENLVMTMVLIDGEYFNYGKLFPEESCAQLRIRAGDLRRELEILDVVHEAKSQHVIRVELQQQPMAIVAVPDVCDGQVPLPGKHEGVEMSVLLNAQCVIEMCKAIDEHALVRLCFVDDEHAMVLAHEHLAMLTMPIRETK